MAPVILIVEDEPAIRELLHMTLTANGFQTEEADDGIQALERISTVKPDLVLLDWMLPGLDGLGVLRRLKAAPETAELPVILITAKSEESDIVLGLEMGASDYITKPFSNKILVARIRALLRRQTEETTDPRIRYGRLTLEPNQRRAVLDGNEFSLTCGEFDLLALLCSRPGHVYTRAQIVARTKGSDYPVTDRAVDVQIVALRRKLGDLGEALQTVRGVGYRMKRLTEGEK